MSNQNFPYYECDAKTTSDMLWQTVDAMRHQLKTKILDNKIERDLVLIPWTERGLIARLLKMNRVITVERVPFSSELAERISNKMLADTRNGVNIDDSCGMDELRQHMSMYVDSSHGDIGISNLCFAMGPFRAHYKKMAYVFNIIENIDHSNGTIMLDHDTLKMVNNYTRETND